MDNSVSPSARPSVNSEEEKPEISAFAAVVATLVGLCLFGLIVGFRAVSAGTVGVVTRVRKVTNRTLHPGANFVIPLIEGTKTIRTRRMTYETMLAENFEGSEADYKDYPVTSKTADGQGVNVTYTVRFFIRPEKAGWIVNGYGSEAALYEKVVKANCRILFRDAVRSYKADYLYSGEGPTRVSDEVGQKLNEEFDRNGLVIDMIGVRQIDFSDKYEAKLEEKQLAEEDVNIAEKKAAKAKKDKEATITAAEAKAEEQRLLRETLNEQVLTKTELDVKMKIAEAMKISAEKGIKIVPDTVLGDGENILYQLPK